MNVDDIARRAATALHDEAARSVDTDAALADILSAPRLVPVRAIGRARRRWAVVAAAATVAAASIGAIVVFGHRDDRTPVIAPDTSVATTTTVTAPQSTVPGPTVPGTTAPDVPTSTVGTTTASTEPVVTRPTSPSETTTPSTPTTTATTDPSSDAAALVAAPPSATEVVSTGAEGTWVQGPGGASRVGEDSFATVLRLPDGRLLAQRRSGFGDWPATDTAPVVWSPGFPSLSATELWPGRDLGGWVVVHDVNVVDGHVIVLVEIQVQSTPGGPANDVRVEDLTDGTSTVLGQVGGWESGVGRLHLASNGWVVGEGSAEVSTYPEVFAMRGDAPSGESLGLVESADCSECPHGFAISHDSSATAWVAGSQLVVRDTVSGATYGPYAIGQVPEATGVDIDLGPGVAVLTFTPYVPDASPVRARLVELANERVVELPGTTATASAVALAPFDVGPLEHPVIDLAECTDASAGEGSGPVDLFARAHGPVLPTQLLADPGLGIRGPYVIVQRYLTDQTYDPARATPGVTVGGRPARVFVGPTGANELQVLTADGSEMYVRGRGFDTEQLIAIANGLTARPTDVAIPGFDFVAPAGSGVLLLDETTELTGATTRYTCSFGPGRAVAVASFVGPQVFAYAVSLDTAGVALMATATSDVVLGVVGPVPDAAIALRSLRSASQAEWDQLVSS